MHNRAVKDLFLCSHPDGGDRSDEVTFMKLNRLLTIIVVLTCVAATAVAQDKDPAGDGTSDWGVRVGLGSDPDQVIVDDLVGSRTGSVAPRASLGRVRGFPFRARLGWTVSPFPAPAASNAACGIPVLRSPAHFASRAMRPTVPEPRRLKYAISAVVECDLPVRWALSPRTPP